MTPSPDSREARAFATIALLGYRRDGLSRADAVEIALAFATAEQQRIVPGEVRELLERCATALNVLSAMCFVANLTMGADTATEMRNDILAALSPDTVQTKGDA